jgi:hypothetical protein
MCDQDEHATDYMSYASDLSSHQSDDSATTAVALHDSWLAPHLRDHVVDEPVLVPDASCLVLGLVLSLVDLRKDHQEAAVGHNSAKIISDGHQEAEAEARRKGQQQCRGTQQRSSEAADRHKGQQQQLLKKVGKMGAETCFRQP